MNQAFRGCYLFGEFRLDGAERRLLRNEIPISLPPKILDTLLLLLENAGHLVEKDEFMKRLWPDTYVGEDALARNISILRKTLGESSDSQSFIATVPTRGYRFVAPVQGVSESEARVAEKQPSKEMGAGEAPAAKEEAKLQGQQLEGAATIGTGVSISHERPAARAWPSPRSWPRRIAFAALVLGVGIVAGLATYYLLSPAPLPKLISMERLTYSGNVDPWPRLVTDGTRIYYLARQGDHWNLMQTSVSGGEAQTIPTPFKNAAVLDVSPDRANLLMGSFEERELRMPLWIRPVQGGALKRVGDITAYEAVWHPDGHQIVYIEGEDGVYIANADGTNAHKFAATDDQPSVLSWSPNGQAMRFVTTATNWEVSADGKLLHDSRRDLGSFPQERAGLWSPDGRYFFLDPFNDGRRDVWAILEAPRLFHRAPSAPVRLTNGPMSYEGIARIKDGHKLFVVGMNAKGDVERYDPKTRQSASLLAGVCFPPLAYSPDGQWVTCHQVEGTILRMRPDGSSQLALAHVESHLAGVATSWSPDGKQIAFLDATKHGTTSVFVVSSDGGAPREVVPDDRNQISAGWDPPAWSPDGKLLAFTRARHGSCTDIWVVNPATNQISLLPGSEGLCGSAWSPDGRFLAAMTDDGHKLMVLDNRTTQWTKLAEAVDLNYTISWSADGKCLYFQDILSNNESLYRVCMGDRKPHLAVSFEPLLRSGVHRAGFNGFAPDGSVIVAVDRSSGDIYALDLELP